MTYVNWGKMLEVLLNNGTDPASGIQLLSLTGESGADIDFSSYDEVWDAWKTMLRYYSDLAVECDAICDRSLETYDTSPFVSVLVDDALELGKTLKEGGCRYDVVSQSNIGPSVVGNSLAVIKHFVFDERKWTFQQLKAALVDNWASLESQRIFRDVTRFRSFGNDEDEVDFIVKDVFDSYLDLLPGYHTIRADRGPRAAGTRCQPPTSPPTFPPAWWSGPRRAPHGRAPKRGLLPDPGYGCLRPHGAHQFRLQAAQ
jgi:formate C-acetyltransferase